MPYAIELKGVSKVYEGKPAVNNIDLQIEKGSVVSILGPNGAGKTTLISLILGLIKPSKGTVQMLGRSPDELSVRQEIGALLQENTVIDGLKVIEVINLFRSYFSNPLPTEKLLKLLGLESVGKSRTVSLSGGQKRRLGFAQSLAGNPSILFLDEPTVGMDVQSRKIFWETVKEFVKDGKTVALTTHYLEEADEISDRIIVMNKGKIIADGSPAILKEHVTNKFVAFKAGTGVNRTLLESLPNVERVEWSGKIFKLYSKNTDQLLRTLFENNLNISDIEVERGKLDEAFEFLTNQSNEKIS